MRSDEAFDNILRLGELAFGAIVAGITGNHLQANREQSTWRLGRFIYAEVIAASSVLVALFWLLPCVRIVTRWPADIILMVCWFAAFGLLTDWINGACGDTFDWSGIGFRGSGNDCGTWKADEAFTFVAAFFWLASALFGWYFRPRDRRGRRRLGWRCYRGRHP